LSVKLARPANMPPIAALIGIFAPAAALAVSVPQPGEIKVFKDWAVGCDNGGICQAVSLVPENEGGFDDWDGPLTIMRTADLDDILKIHVLFTPNGIDRYRMIVDGKLVDTGRVVEGDYPIEIVGADAKKVIGAIARGNKLTIAGPDGKALTQISLAGSSAALRYIDAKQKRARTRTALVAKGRHKFTPLNASIPLLSIDPWKTSERIPETAEIVALVENSVCKDGRYGVVEDQAFPLGQRNGTFRALVLISCGSGAYNFSSVSYIGEYREGEPATKGWTFVLAKFDMQPGWSGESEMPLLVNAHWDAEDQSLRSYAKGRGLGDCGGAERYIWDGEKFRLIEASAMKECRGAYEWITTWRANYRKIEQKKPKDILRQDRGERCRAILRRLFIWTRLCQYHGEIIPVIAPFADR